MPMMQQAGSIKIVPPYAMPQAPSSTVTPQGSYAPMSAHSSFGGASLRPLGSGSGLPNSAGSSVTWPVMSDRGPPNPGSRFVDNKENFGAAPRQLMPQQAPPQVVTNGYVNSLNNSMQSMGTLAGSVKVVNGKIAGATSATNTTAGSWHPSASDSRLTSQWSDMSMMRTGTPRSQPASVAMAPGGSLSAPAASVSVRPPGIATGTSTLLSGGSAATLIANPTQSTLPTFGGASGEQQEGATEDGTPQQGFGTEQSVIVSPQSQHRKVTPTPTPRSASATGRRLGTSLSTPRGSSSPRHRGSMAICGNLSQTPRERTERLRVAERRAQAERDSVERQRSARSRSASVRTRDLSVRAGPELSIYDSDAEPLLVWAGAQAESSKRFTPKEVSDIFKSTVCEEKHRAEGASRWRYSARAAERKAAARPQEFAHGRPMHPDYVNNDWEQSLNRLPAPAVQDFPYVATPRRSLNLSGSTFGPQAEHRPEDALSAPSRLRQKQLSGLGNLCVQPEAASRSVSRNRANGMFGDVAQDLLVASEASRVGSLHRELLRSASGQSVVCLREQPSRAAARAGSRNSSPAPARGQGACTRQVTDALGSSWICFSESDPAHARATTPQPRARVRRDFVQELRDSQGACVLVVTPRGVVAKEASPRPSLF